MSSTALVPVILTIIEDRSPLGRQQQARLCRPRHHFSHPQLPEATSDLNSSSLIPMGDKIMDGAETNVTKSDLVMDFVGEISEEQQFECLPDKLQRLIHAIISTLRR